MTLQNLSKVLDKYESQLGSASLEQFELLKGLPFYDWQHKAGSGRNHAQAISFNHAIGLPQKKNGQPFPLFDYKQLIFDTLHTHKHVWINKATGLGITEFMLRYMAWLCLKDSTLRGSQMCIVTGPRLELAITLIERMKGLFQYWREGFDNPHLSILRSQNGSSKHTIGQVHFDTEENVIVLNGDYIEAYPSHHLDAIRGIPNVSVILLDEADFFSSRATAGC